MSYAPQFDPEELEKALEQRSRRPFRALLARVLENAPSSEAIRALAQRNPDRWAQTLALVGRLGGYNEKLEVEGNINLRIQALSDAELELAVAEELRTLDTTSSDHKDK